MKKKLLAVLAASTLCLPMMATDIMNFKLDDGNTIRYDVEEVEEVTVETIDPSIVDGEQTKMGFVKQKDGTALVASNSADTAIIPEKVLLVAGNVCDVVGIAEHGFYENQSLQYVGIPSSIKTIGKDAFIRCYGLTSIVIPSTVTSIGESAFAGCANLEIIIENIEENMTIGKSAFDGCKSVIFRNPNGYDYVDLGLPSGLKWATCNLGATQPEGYGSYYAWGEINIKSTYSSENAIHYGKDSDALLADGVIDEKENLTSSFDIATKTCGEGWRIPTRADFDELIENCTWKFTTLNDVAGYTVSSKAADNNNYIFIPMAGYFSSKAASEGTLGNYWSATGSPSNYAYVLTLLSGSYKTQTSNIDGGRSIRPVKGK